MSALSSIVKAVPSHFQFFNILPFSATHILKYRSLKLITIFSEMLYLECAPRQDFKSFTKMIFTRRNVGHY